MVLLSSSLSLLISIYCSTRCWTLQLYCRSISPLSSISFSFMYCAAFFIHAYAFRIAMSSWGTSSLIIIRCPFLALFIFSTLKSNLSDYKIALFKFLFTNICMMYRFSFSTYQYSYIWREFLVESMYLGQVLIHFANLYLFIAVRPFTLNVNIDMVGLSLPFYFYFKFVLSITSLFSFSSLSVGYLSILG